MSPMWAMCTCLLWLDSYCCRCTGEQGCSQVWLAWRSSSDSFGCIGGHGWTFPPLYPQEQFRGVPILAEATCQVSQGGSCLGGAPARVGQLTGVGLQGHSGGWMRVLTREMESFRTGLSWSGQVSRRRKERWCLPILLFPEKIPPDSCPSNAKSLN